MRSPEIVAAISGEDNLSPVRRAFSKQSEYYDEHDASSLILQAWRKQVYNHVAAFIKPNSRILELNAGTGIDAIYFAQMGHSVHCTDLSDGMIDQVQKKIERYGLHARVIAEPLDYQALEKIKGRFDYVYSNFGGLNCIEDITPVTQQLDRLLAPGGYVTWTILPPLCLWEILWVLKGNARAAFRRLQEHGTMAHLEGEYFNTHYHPLSKIKKAFGDGFQFLKSEGLGALSPPPSSEKFPIEHPALYAFLNSLDKKARNHFPYNRCADHIIVTFRKKA